MLPAESTRHTITWHPGDVPQSTIFGDVYFSKQDGIQETRHVFLDSNNLPAAWSNRSSFVVGELGFGSGLNFLTTWKLWEETTCASQQLHYVSFERFPLSSAEHRRALRRWDELKQYREEFLSAYTFPIPGFQRIKLNAGRIILTLIIGDANELLPQLTAEVDAWYLDGFAPAENPEMWTENIFKSIASCSTSNTSFSTFTAASEVRRRLERAGFEVNKVPGFGRKREMLRGKFKSASQTRGDSNSPARVAIIGGGLAGTSIAAALAQRKHTNTSITLIEREPKLAQHASGNSAGVLMPYPTAQSTIRSQFYFNAFMFMLEHLRYLKQQTGLEWQQTGVVRLLANDQLKRTFKAIPNLALPERLLRRINQAEAGDITGISVNGDALYFPCAGWVNPAAVCQANIQSRQIQTVLNATALSFEQVDSVWRVYDDNKQLISESEVLVLANACECAQFKATNWLPLTKLRGQVAYVEPSAATDKLKTVLCYDGYTIPTSSTSHFVGATYDHDNYSTEVDPELQRRLIKRLEKWLAAYQHLMSSPAPGRVSFRSTTPDRLPIIGEVLNRTEQEQESRRNLYASVGHGSRGLVSAQLSAEMIAAKIYQEPIPVNRELVSALSPARFRPNLT